MKLHGPFHFDLFPGHVRDMIMEERSGDWIRITGTLSVRQIPHPDPKEGMVEIRCETDWNLVTPSVFK